MPSECSRIADQLRRAFTGDAWHGPPLRELLNGIDAHQAVARPVVSAHNIWELVLHIDIYVRIAFEATQGVPMPKLYQTGHDWPSSPPHGNQTEEDWLRALDTLFSNAERLAGAIESLRDARLDDTVPGRDYVFYHLFHGVVQHSLYHGGQIAVLKKAMLQG